MKLVDVLSAVEVKVRAVTEGVVFFLFVPVIAFPYPELALHYVFEVIDYCLAASGSVFPESSNSNSRFVKTFDDQVLNY